MFTAVILTSCSDNKAKDIKNKAKDIKISDLITICDYVEAFEKVYHNGLIIIKDKSPDDADAKQEMLDLQWAESEIKRSYRKRFSTSSKRRSIEARMKECPEYESMIQKRIEVTNLFQ